MEFFHTISAYDYQGDKRYREEGTKRKFVTSPFTGCKRDKRSTRPDNEGTQSINQRWCALLKFIGLSQFDKVNQRPNKTSRFP